MFWSLRTYASSCRRAFSRAVIRSVLGGGIGSAAAARLFRPDSSANNNWSTLVTSVRNWSASSRSVILRYICVSSCEIARIAVILSLRNLSAASFAICLSSSTDLVSRLFDFGVGVPRKLQQEDGALLAPGRNGQLIQILLDLSQDLFLPFKLNNPSSELFPRCLIIRKDFFPRLELLVVSLVQISHYFGEAHVLFGVQA